MEGEAGEAEDVGFPVAGEAFDAAGLGGGQPDRGDAGRAGLGAADGQRRVPAEICRSAWLTAGSPTGAGVFWRRRCCGNDVSAGERGLDGGGPQLGEGGQRGVPVDRVPSAGLGLVPAERVLSVLKVVSTGQRRPAMVMK